MLFVFIAVMKNSILICSILLFTMLTYSQEKEKPKVNLYENLFSVKLSYITKLSEKWSLQNELEISNAHDFNELEFTPISMNYNITKKWKVFGGPKLRYSFLKDDFYIPSQSNFSVLTQVGTRYDFSTAFFGEILYEYKLVNKNFNQAIEPSGGNLKFGVGFKF